MQKKLWDKSKHYTKLEKLFSYQQLLWNAPAISWMFIPVKQYCSFLMHGLLPFWEHGLHQRLFFSNILEFGWFILAPVSIDVGPNIIETGV